jgi:hypothetical protein
MAAALKRVHRQAIVRQMRREDAQRVESDLVE